MIWADRLTIFLAGCLVLVILFACIDFDGMSGGTTLNVQVFWVVFKTLVLPLWLFLRGVDWLLGGPRVRRRSRLA